MQDFSDLPDETPVADAVEQDRAAVDVGADETDREAAVAPPAGVPLEASDSDWQEQNQTVDIDPEEDVAHD